MEQCFLEKFVVKSSTVAVDLNTVANVGAYIDMKDAKRITFIMDVAAGTTPSSHTVSFQQHTVGSAGTPADLTIDNGYFHKADTATYFTKVAPTGTKAASFDIDSVVADAKFMAVFEILAEDLTDGYRWVSCNVTDAGGSQMGSVLAIVEPKTKPAYTRAV